MHRLKSASGKISRIGVSRHLQVYSFLISELACGKLKPKDLLPSEPALVARYRVSRTTVRRALARLEREGKIVRKAGSGTYVRDVRKIALRCPCCGRKIRKR